MKKRMLHLFKAYRKSINPPYDAKKYLVLLVTFFLILTIPVTILLLNNQTSYQSNAATTIRPLTTRAYMDKIIQLTAGYTTLVVVGNQVWIPTGTNILVYNFDGSSAGNPIPISTNSITVLGTNVYALTVNGTSPTITKLDFNGNIISSFSGLTSQRIIQAVGTNLWVVNCCQISQFKPDGTSGGSDIGGSINNFWYPPSMQVIGTKVWVPNRGNIQIYNFDGTSGGTTITDLVLDSPYAAVPVGSEIWVANGNQNETSNISQTIARFHVDGTSAGSQMSTYALGAPNGTQHGIAVVGNAVWILTGNNISILRTNQLAFAPTPPPLITTPLPIGWYSAAAAGDPGWTNEATSGSTLIVAYHGTSTDSSVQPFLDKMQTLGMKVLLQIEPTFISTQNTSSISAFVNQFKNHPALYGWYEFDEPEFYNPFVDTAKLQTGYNAIKQADPNPNHPVGIAHGNMPCTYVNFIGGGPGYFSVPDLVLFDNYPIHNQGEFGTDSNGDSLSSWTYILNNCVASVHAYNKKSIPVLQAYNWGGVGDRFPTYGEERYMVYMSAIQNTAGMTFWKDYSEPDSIKQTVNTLIREVTPLAYVIQNGIYSDPSLDVNQQQIQYKYGVNGTNYYIIAANYASTSATVQFTLPTGVITNQIQTINDNYDTTTLTYNNKTIPTSIDINGNTFFTDTFSQYQVHVYSFTPTILSPTLTSVPTLTLTPSSLPTSISTPTFTPFPTSTPSLTSTGIPSPTTIQIPGDINGDGKVDLTDFSMLAADYGKDTTKTPPDILKYPGSDINRDGKVDLTDFSMLARNYTG